MKFPHPMRRKDDRTDRRLRRGLYILPSLFTRLPNRARPL